MTFFALLAPPQFLFVWDQATTLLEEKSSMSPKLFLTPTMMTLISAMMLVFLYWKILPLTVVASKLKPYVIKGPFNPNFFYFYRYIILTFSFFFRAAPVALPNNPNFPIPDGAMFVVSGWGTTSEGGSLPSTLRYGIIWYIMYVKCITIHFFNLIDRLRFPTSTMRTALILMDLETSSVMLWFVLEKVRN